MTGFHTARIVSLAVLAGAALAATAAGPAAAATTYTITDLGSLGLGETVGSAINATGQVTGYSYLSTLVPTPACPPVYGNNKKNCVEHPWHAFAYSNGQMTDLGTVGGGNFSAGSAINRSGWVAGGSATKNGGSDAFLWNGQKMIDLGGLAPLAGSDSRANGINDNGQAVGQWGTSNTPDHAFSYSNSTITSLPEPGFTGSSGCEAGAINNTGQIAGVCSDTSGSDHLGLWHNGTVTDLGTLGGATFIQAVSINNKGQIVGTVFTGGTSEGFLYSNGTITNLGGFLATAINDNGQIVANTTSNHALLLTPS